MVFSQQDSSSDQGDKKLAVFLAGQPSHGYGSHEHYAGCMLLAQSLEKAMPNFETRVYKHQWPREEDALDQADVIIMYADGGGRHPALKHKEQLQKQAERGCGIICLHYAVEVPKQQGGEEFLNWIGGYFEMNWSVNPHWVAEFESMPKHPIANGVQPFSADDEWYYNMRFRPKMENVTPILTAVPPKHTLERPRWSTQQQPTRPQNGGPAATCCLGVYPRRWRARLWIHRWTQSLELGRTQLSKTGTQCNRLVCTGRCARRWCKH